MLVSVVMCFPENDRLRGEMQAKTSQQRELEERISQLINERRRLEQELEVLEAEHQARLAALAQHQAMADAFREKLSELRENQEREEQEEEEEDQS